MQPKIFRHAFDLALNARWGSINQARAQAKRARKNAHRLYCKSRGGYKSAQSG